MLKRAGKGDEDGGQVCWRYTARPARTGSLERCDVGRKQQDPDVYRFDPLEWLGEYLTQAGSSTSRDVAGGNTTDPSRPGTDTRAEPRSRELLGDLREAHKRVQAVRSSLRPEMLQQFTDRIRRDPALLEITAGLIAPHILKVYHYKQGSKGSAAATAPGHADEVMLDRAHAPLVSVISTVFDAARGDGFDIWQSLAEWMLTQLVAWGLNNLERELGAPIVRDTHEEELAAKLDSYLRDADRSDIYRDRYNYLLLTYSPELARFAVESLDLPRASLDRLEQLLGLRPLAVASVLPSGRTASPRDLLASLLHEGHLRVMSSAHYHALREALYKRTFVQVDGTPWPTAQLDKGNALGHAQLRPLIADAQPVMPAEEVERLAAIMWRQREELSDLDADALDALSALWLHQARSIQDRAVADVNELLAMRGIKPKLSGQGRRGGYSPEQRAEMMRALSHIQNLWLNMAEIEVYEDNGRGGRRRKPIKKAVQSRPFVITDQTGQLRMDGYLDVDRFIFRPGEVFAYFLMGPGHQTALLSAKALKYDYYRQVWEKRLARYLSWQWRTQARTGEYLRPYRVITLIEAVGEGVNHRKPSLTRDRLEKALDVLQSDEVVRMWQYDRWDESAASSRGWVHEWVQATVLIEPPEVVKEQYQRLERLGPSSIGPALPEGLPERIKRRRKELGLSQMEAAEQVGISQSYLSLLERGKASEKQLSQSVRKVLKAWLGDS